MIASAIDFLNALFWTDLPDDERAILCGFPGDPSDKPKNAWRPRSWRPGREIPIECDENAYVCVATFSRRPDRSFRRRKENFRAAYALMVDDVGTKVPTSVLEDLAPSAIIETSPANFQAWYFFHEPVADRDAFTRLVQAFIDAQLLGSDPGMAGCTRVGRLPGFLNGKAKYGGAFRTVLTSLHAVRRYTVLDIVRAFNLRYERARALSSRQSLELLLRPHGTPQQFVDERRRAFDVFFRQMFDLRMLKRDVADLEGWIGVVCPWTGQHTDRADNGAALRLPAEENGWHGAFKCHHGGCAGRGWRELTDFLADVATRETDARNEQA